MPNAQFQVHVDLIFDFQAMTQTFALRATDLKPINSIQKYR